MYQILWEDASRPCGDDHVTKSRNRKLIRVTSSNECQKHSASISVTMTYIWTKFGIEHKYHTINTPPSWIFRLCEKKNVNNSGLDKDICITFYGIMHWTSAYTTACTTLQAVFTASTVVQAVLTVWTVVSCSNNFSTKHGTVVDG